MDIVGIERFAPHVGQQWRVDTTPAEIEIRLEAARPRPLSPWSARTPFTLIFSTPWAKMLLDGVYRMRPDAGGDPIEVHLAQSLAPQGERRFYHAEFN